MEDKIIMYTLKYNLHFDLVLLPLILLLHFPFSWAAQHTTLFLEFWSQKLTSALFYKGFIFGC